MRTIIPIAVGLITLTGCQTAGTVLQALSDMGSGIVAIQTEEQLDGVYVARVSVDKQEMRLLGQGVNVVPRSFDGQPHRTIFSPDRLGSALLVYSDYAPQAARQRSQQPIVHILYTGDAESGGHMARLNNIEAQITERIPGGATWYHVVEAYWPNEDNISVRVAGSWTEASATAEHLVLTYNRYGDLQSHRFISRQAPTGGSPHVSEAGSRITIQGGALHVDGNPPVRNPPHPAIPDFTPRAANGLMWTR
jgi:hypothetical protein